MDDLVFLDENVFRTCVLQSEDGWSILRRQFPKERFIVASQSLTSLLDAGLRGNQAASVGADVVDFLQNHVHETDITVNYPDVHVLIRWVVILYECPHLFTSASDAVPLATALSLKEAGRVERVNYEHLRLCTTRKREIAEADLYPAELLVNSPFRS